MEPLQVGLGERSYPIAIGSDCLERLGPMARERLPRCERLLVVSNPTIAPLHAAPVLESLEAAGFRCELVEIPDGEAHKTTATVEGLYDRLIGGGYTRQAALAALGGGVVGDVTGFAAASYMRGVPFIQVPSTLLAMVDSSVGGKTGVNHPRAKNIIGAFWQPRLVFADMALLRTLAPEELRSGFAEVIKHGVIRDAEYFAFLEERLEDILALDGEAMARVVRRSCEIKAAVVAEDEREGGLRAILNFGHTIGHALEALGNYGRLRHGECVSIGMLAAARIAERLGMVGPELPGRLGVLCERAGLPLRCERFGVEAVLERMGSDKKVLDGRLRFVLPTALGEVTIRDDVPEAIVREALLEMGAPAC